LDDLDFLRFCRLYFAGELGLPAFRDEFFMPPRVALVFLKRAHRRNPQLGPVLHISFKGHVWVPRLAFEKGFAEFEAGTVRMFDLCRRFGMSSPQLHHVALAYFGEDGLNERMLRRMRHKGARQKGWEDPAFQEIARRYAAGDPSLTLDSIRRTLDLWVSVETVRHWVKRVCPDYPEGRLRVFRETKG
jgi:hypothetical protein